MKKSIFVAAALLSPLFATAAQAQGAYGEIHGGWDNVSVLGSSQDGVTYGVALGYEFPIAKKAFIGVEANADDSTTKACANDLIILGDRTCASAGRDLSAVARAGLDIAEGHQLYALAGYTNARLKFSYNDGVATTSSSGNGDGLRLGAGYKMGLGAKSYAKVEYRYSNYEAGFSRNQVVFGLGLKF